MARTAARFTLTTPGQGGKTEIRAGRNGGWLVLDFDFDASGNRVKTDEKKAAADGYVLQLIREADPDFFEKLVRLSQHPHITREFQEEDQAA